MDDQHIFNLCNEKLFTSVVGDVMDGLGLRHQCLPPHIRPLSPTMKLVGRAMTVLEADCASTVKGSGDSDPFGLMFEALDSLKPGEIYICTGSSPSYACWGELMTTRAKILSARGAVMEGYSRDTHGVLKMDFPVFSMGSYAQDQGIRGRVIDFNCPIEFSNKVLVEPGDLILGDIDGVVAVPRLVVQEVIQKALEKVSKENLVKKAIEAGMSTREAWNTYGVM